MRKRDCLWSLSRAGSGRRFVRKVERTFVTVDLTVPPVSIVLLVLPCLFLRQLPANADKRWFCCSILYSLRNSSLMPFAPRNRRHRSKHPICFWWDAGAIPAFWSRMEVTNEASRLSLVAVSRFLNSGASVRVIIN